MRQQQPQTPHRISSVPPPPPPRAPARDDEWEEEEIAVRGLPRKRRASVSGRLALILLLLLILGGVAFYFASYRPLLETAGTVDQLRTEQTTLQQRVEEQDAELEALRTERDALTAERDALTTERDALAAARGALETTVEERNAELERLRALEEQLTTSLRGEIDRGEIEIRGGDALAIDVQDQVLFASGRAELSPRGKRVLRRVAESLATAEGRVIEVEGHTDSMPVGDEIRERFPTNWELSTTRATNVVRFLQDECGISGERLVASGYSQYRPTASNGTPRGRQRNRRIGLTLRRGITPVTTAEGSD